MHALIGWKRKTLEKAWAESRSRPPSYQLCVDIMFIKVHGSHETGDETVSHLPRKELLNL